jgi:ferredoxin
MILGVMKMKKIEVEKERCIGCGACVNIASETFDFDEEGKSTVLSNEHLGEEVVQLAIESCPTSAISIVDVEEQEFTSDSAEELEEDCCACEECHCEHCDCSMDEEEAA